MSETIRSAYVFSRSFWFVFVQVTSTFAGRSSFVVRTDAPSFV
jgi:hypothetical protein